MMSNIWVIMALLLTSLMVRVLPSLIIINFGEKTQHLIEEVLPSSIFICFITYIVMPEVTNGLSISFLAFISVVILTIILKFGLIFITLIATTLYYVLS